MTGGGSDESADRFPAVVDTGALDGFVKSLGDIGGFRSVLKTSSFDLFVKSVGDSGGFGSVLDTSAFDSFVKSLGDIGGLRSSKTSSFDTFVWSLGDTGGFGSVLDTSAFDSFVKSMSHTSGFDSIVKAVVATSSFDILASQMAAELGHAVGGLAVDDAPSPPSDREVVDAGFAVPTEALGNREWVFVVALAEVVRQLALEQPGVTEAQAALIMLAAIWILAASWARDRRGRA
jgi:hypothetical protein